MADAKTFVVQRREPRDAYRFDAADGALTVYTTVEFRDAEALEVTIRPRRSKRERKIDTVADLIPGAWAAQDNYDPGYKRIAESIVAALEAIDAEEP